MSVKFPHVGNDAYPHLDNVQPFRRTVPFDYERYDYTATIKLCSVSWTSDYAHVVNWQSEQQRDTYFAELAGHTVTLANGFTRTQLDSVRVNVPYDVALTYNYVFMQVPVLTENQPINHETQDGIRTVCAWIQEAIYQAPSATELVLALDYWTTYLPHLQAPVGMMLHRGHAPAYSIDVDTYLADPRGHCTDLLTPDVDFGTYDESVSSTLFDIAQGEKMIVLASTIPYAEINNLNLATIKSGSSTAASYYDTGARDGHQVGVSGYEWHYGGHAYDNMDNPSAYSGIGAAMPTYEYLYAIEAASASSSLSTLASRLPQFITSIQAAYILPRRALVLASSSYGIAGVTLYRVNPTSALNDLTGITLNKAAFNYPSRYADIAKLYTSPYAHMVVSDALGQSLDVRIEDMGSNVRILEQVSPLTDCLRWDVLLADVNSAGTNNYTWTAINGSSRSMSLPGADIGRYTLELGIPTYALYLDGKTTWSMGAYQDAQATRDNAVVGYQATMRSANTGKENADDSADTGKTNADASADTGKTNADASADTGRTNAYDSANNSVTVTANNGSNAQSNATVANNLRNLSTAMNITTQNNLTADAVQNIYDSSNADLEYTEFATDINLKSEAVSSIQNMVGNAIAGNAMGVINSGVSGIVNITTSSALSDLSLQNVLDHQAIAQSHTNTANGYHTTNASNQASYANSANTSTTNNNVTTANTNATNTANTAKANATRTRDTAKANATRTQTVAKNNATRTQTVTKDNASYSRATAETNAKAALEQTRLSYVRQGSAHSLDNPVRFGAVSGNHEPDALMRRVLQVRIETQSASAIARAGDLMKRYGYAYDGYWIVTDWCPANQKGCYWEATDVMVDASAIANPAAFAAFVAILKAGVTVWNDPTKIGGLPW